MQCIVHGQQLCLITVAAIFWTLLRTISPGQEEPYYLGADAVFPDLCMRVMPIGTVLDICAFSSCSVMSALSP